MTSIATLGPQGSHAWQAAQLYDSTAAIKLFPRIADAVAAFQRHETDLAILPVYNTREGEIKDFFRIMEKIKTGFWINNIVLPIQLSLGALDLSRKLELIAGTSSVFRQCEDYLAANFSDIALLAVPDIAQAIHAIIKDQTAQHGVIDAEEVLTARNLKIREREVVPHNRTRFAVLGHVMAGQTAYDATAMITAPLKDRVGMLYDILGEFSRRAINLLDLRSESDVKTQKLQIYIEAEGHIEDQALRDAVLRIENDIVQEPGAIKILGSYPRLDMRTKHIKTFGFIGTGDMSKWFAAKLENEGYKIILTGRSSAMKPEEMVPQVDVVVICVPISATAATVEKYGPLLMDGQALILLAGEAENTVNNALAHTRQGVEVMLVHNLWGPQAANMKSKIAAVVRTPRSGLLCSEFEAFLYKHGAEIHHDTPNQHDLLMGVSQKLPTCISVALAQTISQNRITPGDIDSHSTLTSLYSILAMSRVHSQNARTYAEIMSTQGDGCKIVRNFVKNLAYLIDLADNGRIEELCAIIEQNRAYLTAEFLQARMGHALAVDETLGKIIRS